MAKEITGYVKLQIKGGQANPAPPVGPALGQRGIKQLFRNLITVIPTRRNNKS